MVELFVAHLRHHIIRNNSTSFTKPTMMVKIASHDLKHHEDLVEGEDQRRCLLV